MYRTIPKGMYDAGMYGASMYGEQSDYANFILDGRTQNDADAQAVISACSLSAGAQQNAAYFLVGALKFYSIWSKMVGLYGLCGGTAAAHKVNWKTVKDNAGLYDLTYINGGALTHSANGVLGGSSAAGNTGLTFSILDKNSVHFSLYSRTSGSIAGNDMGNYDAPGSSYSRLLLNLSGLVYWGANSTAEFNNTAAAGDGTGLYISNRINTNTCSLFKRGTKVNTRTSAPQTTTSAYSFYLFNVNQSGSPSTSASGRVQSFCSIGSGLTDSEAITLSWIVQTYQRILGRDV